MMACITLMWVLVGAALGCVPVLAYLKIREHSEKRNK